MRQYNLACVVGARPNFMKIAPILRALEPYANIRTTLIHTGQHFDPNLSDVFFQELGIRQPDIRLDVKASKPGAQTARILEGLEGIFEEPVNNAKFHRVLVVGDVNSTLAAGLAAAKLNIPVAHVEAGLRSFDRTMPEEVNRLVTDGLSDMFFVSEPSGVENLLREGHPRERIFLVGNVMIDTVRRMLPVASARNILSEFGLRSGEFAVATFHRPSNVDSKEGLERLFDLLCRTAESSTIVFPIHPRTKKRLEEFGLLDKISRNSGIKVIPPLGYIDFLALTSRAKFVVTDSGGLQEEATALLVPCLTLRENTERPITVVEGTNTLVGSDVTLYFQCVESILNGTYKQGKVPEYWDGNAADRIASILDDESKSAEVNSASQSNPPIAISAVG